MNLHVDIFQADVKHLDGYGVPVSVKRIDRRRVALILRNDVIVVRADELINTVRELMK